MTKSKDKQQKLQADEATNCRAEPPMFFNLHAAKQQLKNECSIISLPSELSFQFQIELEVILQPSCKYSEARESTQNDGYEMQQCCTTSKIKKGSLDVPLYILNA